LDDPRFPTVLGVEGEIDIEISILSPMKPIRDARRRFTSASTAPRSIAAAGRRCCCRRWPPAAIGSGEQFLSALSVKAGLGTKGYRSPGARLSVFQAQVLAM
jgi:AMMECR1 domain-containing protein